MQMPWRRLSLQSWNKNLDHLLQSPPSKSLYYSKDLPESFEKFVISVSDHADDNTFGVSFGMRIEMWRGARLGIETDCGPCKY
jgi:hypothetical protein